MDAHLAQVTEVNPVVRLLCVAITVYTLILFAKVILSWVAMFGTRIPSTGPLRAIVDLIDDVTEPVLRPLRGLIPPVSIGAVGLDLSIILLFVFLVVARQALGC
ncbi:MAG: YggT family protein [Actinomycetota bacterium]